MVVVMSEIGPIKETPEEARQAFEIRERFLKSGIGRKELKQLIPK